jgi:hypothetical protein
MHRKRDLRRNIQHFPPPGPEQGLSIISDQYIAADDEKANEQTRPYAGSGQQKYNKRKNNIGPPFHTDRPGWGIPGSFMMCAHGLGEQELGRYSRIIKQNPKKS